MDTLAAILITAAAVTAAWYLWRLFRVIRTDGHIFRASSGLPSDWSPSAELPSLPYVVKPHH